MGNLLIKRDVMGAWVTFNGRLHVNIYILHTDRDTLSRNLMGEIAACLIIENKRLLVSRGPKATRSLIMMSQLTAGNH